MIYDVRTYDLKPGKVPEYMAVVREVGLPIRRDHGGRLVGWYYSVMGEINQVIHIWAYEDFGQMEEEGKAFRGDPRWINEYVPRVEPLLVRQRNQIMKAAEFAPQAV